MRNKADEKNCGHRRWAGGGKLCGGRASVELGTGVADDVLVYRSVYVLLDGGEAWGVCSGLIKLFSKRTLECLGTRV